MSAVGEKLIFKAAPVKAMPRLVCAGYVSAVLEPKVSRSGNYITQQFQIDAIDSGRSIREMLLYRPEWLQPGFDPESIAEDIDDEKVANGVMFVYGLNINNSEGYELKDAEADENGRKPKDSTSKLRGLAGSREGFEILSNRLLSQGEPTMENTFKILTEFFEEQAQKDVKFGYVLQQQYTKTSEINPETQKPVYIAENRYEIGNYFDLTDKNVERMIKACERSQGRMRMTFETDGVPF